MLFAAQVLHAVGPSARPSRLCSPLGRAIRKPVASSNQVGKEKLPVAGSGSDGPWEPAARWRQAAYGLNQFRRGSVPKKKPDIAKARTFFRSPYRVVRPDPAMLKWVLLSLIARPLLPTHSPCEVPDLLGIFGGTWHRPGSYPHRGADKHYAPFLLRLTLRFSKT